MIFRNLYRRMLVAQFGQFVDKSVLEKMLATAPLTEWQALKFFLPRRWFHSPEQDRAALAEVARLAAIHSKGRKPEAEE